MHKAYACGARAAGRLTRTRGFSEAPDPRSPRPPPRRGWWRARRTSRRRPRGVRRTRPMVRFGSGAAKRTSRRFGAAAHSARGGELGQEGQAEALGDQPAERGEARGAQVHTGRGRGRRRRRRAPGRSGSGRRRAGGAARAPCPRGAARLRRAERPRRSALPASRKRSSKSGAATRSGSAHRQRHHRGVERALADLVDQPVGLRLAHAEVEREVAGAEPRQRGRQQVGRDRRDHADPEPPGEAAVPARDLLDLARPRRGSRAARRTISRPVGVITASRAPRSTRRTPSAASSSRICTESAGWLTLTAAAARPKCAVVRERDKVAQLLEGERHRIRLSKPQRKCNFPLSDGGSIPRDRPRAGPPSRSRTAATASGSGSEWTQSPTNQASARWRTERRSRRARVRSNRDWWPNQLNLRILHQNSAAVRTRWARRSTMPRRSRRSTSRR